MRKEDLKDWTRDRLKDEIVNLSEKNFNLEWRIKQFEESEGRWKCENESLKKDCKSLSDRALKAEQENAKLKDENKALKQKIQYIETMLEASYKPESAESVMRKTGLFTEKQIRDICDYEPQLAPDDDISAFNYDCIKLWREELDYKKKNSELQDQHQQDCIRINDLTTTIHVLSGLYSTLRKNVGMD